MTTKLLEPIEQTDSGWIFKCPECGMPFESGDMGGGSLVQDVEAEHDARTHCADTPPPTSDSGRGDRATTRRVNAVTLTNQIALVLTQSAHANLSNATAALLAQRIVESHLTDYVQAVNGWEAMRDALQAMRDKFNDHDCTQNIGCLKCEALDAADAVLDPQP